MATVTFEITVQCADPAEYAQLQAWAAALKPADWQLLQADADGKADTYRVTLAGVPIPQPQ